MDALSVGGFILAFFAIIVGSILKGAGVGSLVNGAAFTIVVLGSGLYLWLGRPARPPTGGA